MTATIERAEVVEQRRRDVAAMFDALEVSQNDAGESAATDSPANSNHSIHERRERTWASYLTF